MVRRNYPYFGKANGFPTYLRRQFPPDAYVAIELEINQKHVLKGGRQWRLLRCAVLKSLAEAVAENNTMQATRGKAIDCNSAS